MTIVGATSPTQSNAQAAIRTFLLDVLPSGVDVIAGVVNRVPEPKVGSFVTMVPLRFEPFNKPLDGYQDCKFTGSIAGTSMTVTNVAIGTILVGATVWGIALSPVRISAQVSGTTGGVGIYTVEDSRTFSPGTLSAGTKIIQQNTRLVVQLDFHATDTTASDMAQTVSQTFRDEYGVAFFADLDSPLDGVVPLYSDTPKYLPFINAEQQYEWRWVMEMAVQVNQVVIVPQQFADVAQVTIQPPYQPG